VREHREELVLRPAGRLGGGTRALLFVEQARVVDGDRELRRDAGHDRLQTLTEGSPIGAHG
jgi:hypothetical protein